MTVSRPLSMPVVALLLGAAMWGVVWYPMRLLEAAGLHGLWLTLLVYLGALAASLPRTGASFKEVYAYPGILLPLALTAGWTNIAFVLAVLEGNILRVLLLFYLSPLWAVLLAWFILGERLSVQGWVTLLVAMSGALLMLWNPEIGAPRLNSAADWLGITAGMAFAISNVLIRKGQQVSLPAKVGASWTGVVLLAGLLILFSGKAAPSVSANAVMGALGLGIGGILVMTVLVQYGVTRLPVQRSAVILLFELVAGALSQQFLTNETMTALEWGGGALIVAAAYVSARRAS